MSIKAGTKLGPYEILAPIGAGGMGEVYRAKDTRLDRIVALKVLPSHLSENSNLKQRFEREARAISSLSHPHICSLYDIGHHDGMDFLVMEYLEGQTLASRLEKGPLRVDEVFKTGIQIAEALEKAHRQGIVHRDLKPANIMMTKSGAKLLDFGLAKFPLKQAEPVGSIMETRDRPLTEEGTILGTIQYMAPEQLEGKDADARTDIFALGEVLYESIIGQRTFKGTSKAAVISSILSSEPPPISTIQPLTPPGLEHVVRKCLAKDADERWQSAHDVASELKWIAESSQSSPRPAEKLGRPRNWERIGWMLATLLLLGTAVSFYFTREPRDMSLLRLSIVPEGETRITGQLAISPDGKNVAFVAKTLSGETSLWVRGTSSPRAKKLPGSSNAVYPFWSPDSRNIAFFSDGKLKRISMDEGPPQTICDAPVGRGGSWNKDNVIIFSPNFTATSIHRVSANGGKSTPVFPAVPERTTIHPKFLPDQNHFVFQLGGSEDVRGIYVGSLDSTEIKFVLKNSARAEVVEPGWILFVRENNLMVSPFDLKKLEPTGEAKPIVESISFDGAYHSFSLSTSGVLCYSNVDLINTQLVWVDRSGKEMANIGTPGQFLEPTLSYDEKRLIIGAVEPSSSRVNLYTIDLARSAFSRLTNDPDSNHYGSILSPDQSQVVYSSRSPKANFDLYSQSTAGTAPKKALLEMREAQFADDWSSDGRFILFENEDPETKYDLWYLPLFGDRKPQPYVQSPSNDAHGRFSPDGKWVAYGADEIGRSEIYVRRFPDAGRGKWQISTGGGDQPYWRGDGKELYYLAPDGKIMAVEVNAGETFDAGVPSPLFQTYVIPQGLVGSDRNQYAVTNDGQRFIVNSSPAQAIFAPINLVFNWTAMLRK